MISIHFEVFVWWCAFIHPCLRATAMALRQSTTPPRRAAPASSTPPPRRAALASATPPPAPRRALELSRLEHALRARPEDLQRISQILREDETAAVLPGSNSRPVLTIAIASGCSVACLRLLLAFGAQVAQVGLNMQSPLDALLASTMPSPVPMFAWPANAAATAQWQRAIRRNYVDMAIALMQAGAKRSSGQHVRPEWYNELTLRCVQEYEDAIATAVWRRWTRRQQWKRCFEDICTYIWVAPQR